jgi:hypothetical protein
MSFKQVKLTFVNLISGSEIGSGSDILILEIDANFPVSSDYLFFPDFRRVLARGFLDKGMVFLPMSS